MLYLYHPIYLQHDTGAGHPETSQRLQVINRALENSSLKAKIRHIQPDMVEDDILTLVHSAGYLHDLRQAMAAGARLLDYGDTVVSPESLQVARYAAGAAVSAVDVLMKGEETKVFCAVRPPGHHAEKNNAMGFCIFNNIALAARYAKKTGLAERILIVDWDVHHGNGTQHQFEEDPTVFYYSLHQYPFYPGTGSNRETGIGRGAGYTLNRPLPAGSGDREYLDCFSKDLDWIAGHFQAELVLISAGFDAHRDDPMAGMQLSDQGFAKMTERVVEYAEKFAGGRIISLLEGGYNYRALADSVLVHLNGLNTQ